MLCRYFALRAALQVCNSFCSFTILRSESSCVLHIIALITSPLRCITPRSAIQFKPGHPIPSHRSFGCSRLSLAKLSPGYIPLCGFIHSRNTMKSTRFQHLCARLLTTGCVTVLRWHKATLIQVCHATHLHCAYIAPMSLYCTPQPVVLADGERRNYFGNLNANNSECDTPNSWDNLRISEREGFATPLSILLSCE